MKESNNEGTYGGDYSPISLSGLRKYDAWGKCKKVS